MEKECQGLPKSEMSRKAKEILLVYGEKLSKLIAVFSFIIRSFDANCVFRKKLTYQVRTLMWC